MSEGIHWLASYPKSGNTWVRALLSNYLSDSDAPVPINELRFGFQAVGRSWIDEMLGFETADLPAAVVDRFRPGLHRQIAGEAGDILFCKTHELFRHNAQGEAIYPADATAGVVLIVRNPLDVAVSFARFFDLGQDAAIQTLNDELAGTDPGTRLDDAIPIRHGSWSSHVASWLDSGLPLHLVTYEQLLVEPESALAAILMFAGIAVDDDRVRQAVEFSRFERLRSQEADIRFAESSMEAANFFRTGQEGGWREILTDAQAGELRHAHREMMQRLDYPVA